MIAKDADDAVSHIYSAGLNNYGQIGHVEKDEDTPTNKDTLTKVRIC